MFDHMSRLRSLYLIESAAAKNSEQHDGRDAARRTGSSAAAETWYQACQSDCTIDMTTATRSDTSGV